jgi:hypothetical protein
MREAVTNRRIFQHNEETGALEQLSILENFDIVVEDERRVSRASLGGLYGGGMFYGQRASQSWTIGSVLIMKYGVGRMKFANVSNPASLKTLILTIKREEKPQG